MRTAAHIIETVGKLVKKYDTRDPYELCKCLEIKIHFYNLEKKLKGFFFYQSRQKNIVIDSNVKLEAFGKTAEFQQALWVRLMVQMTGL